MRRRFFGRTAPVVLAMAVAVVAAVAVVVELAFAADATTTSEYDSTTGLVIAPGYKVVTAHCIACHSARIIIQQGMDRDHWRETVEWMQEEQGLWPIPEPMLTQILDYLATHYGPARPHFSPSQP